MEYEDATVEYLEYRMSEGAFTEVKRTLAWRYQKLYTMEQYNVIMIWGEEEYHMIEEHIRWNKWHSTVVSAPEPIMLSCQIGVLQIDFRSHLHQRWVQNEYYGWKQDPH